MRLDHLLSREHFILPVAGAVVVFVVLCFLVFRVARGEWSVPGPVLWGWGRCRVLGLLAWLVIWVRVLACVWVSWLVGCFLYSGASICDAGFFVLVFVLLVILLFGFVVCKGVRWMPWYQGPMKGVVDCDMPRGVVERALIRGCPNGGTQPGLCLVTVF